MKKALSILLFGLVLSGSALAEKVTYADALADHKAWADKQPNRPTATAGLDDSELGQYDSRGKWKRVGSSTALNDASAYALILSPNAEGQSCLRGEKGFIVSTTAECVDWHASGKHCNKYGPSVPNFDVGFKAECR